MTEEQQADWTKTIRNAVDYLHALADFIPHNEVLNKHIGRLSKAGVQIRATDITG